MEDIADVSEKTILKNKMKNVFTFDLLLWTSHF